MNNRIFIRTDANQKIASGHIMRCLTIANALKEENIDVVFLVSDEVSVSYVDSEEFKVEVLNSDWNNIDPEISQTKAVFESYECKNPLILVDTYSITSNYIHELSKIARIWYLGIKNDSLDGVKAIINYDIAVHADQYNRFIPETYLYLGPRYAPLRPDFYKSNFELKNSVSRVLIMSGATDPFDTKTKILQRCLKEEYSSRIEYIVLVGKMSKIYPDLSVISKKFSNVVVEGSTDDIASLMSGCDIAISACGTTMYELASLGVPTIHFAISKEQLDSAIAFGEQGISMYCGAAFKESNEVPAKVANSLSKLVKNFDLRNALSKRSRAIVDGAGAKRIAQLLASNIAAH